MRSRVIVENSVKIDLSGEWFEDRWELAFEQGTWEFDDDDGELCTYEGYRFIWYRNGKKMGHRGQARIPKPQDMMKLIMMAQIEGWFDLSEGSNLELTTKLKKVA